MDFVLIIQTAAIASVFTYGILHAEAWFRRRALRARGPKPDSGVPSELKEVARVQRAAEGIVCGCIRHHGVTKVKDYVIYADGDKWCTVCDAIEEDE